MTTKNDIVRFMRLCYEENTESPLDIALVRCTKHMQKLIQRHLEMRSTKVNFCDKSPERLFDVLIPTSHDHRLIYFIITG
jgi:hypothetical protein